jgi:hypothetical protein
MAQFFSVFYSLVSLAFDTMSSVRTVLEGKRLKKPEL